MTRGTLIVALLTGLALMTLLVNAVEHWTYRQHEARSRARHPSRQGSDDQPTGPEDEAGWTEWKEGQQ